MVEVSRKKNRGISTGYSDDESDDEGGGGGDGEPQVTFDHRSYVSSVCPGAKPTLRPCAACGKLEDAKGDHKACSGCRSVAYCGSACQRAHWPAHKAECKAAQKRIADDKHGLD